jgi:hypothetical protein
MFAFVTHAGSRITGVKSNTHYLPLMLYMCVGCLHAVRRHPSTSRSWCFRVRSRFAYCVGSRSHVDHAHSAAASVLTLSRGTFTPTSVALHAVLPRPQRDRTPARYYWISSTLHKLSTRVAGSTPAALLSEQQHVPVKVAAQHSTGQC